MTAWEHVFRRQMAAALAQLHQEGFTPPLYCAFIDSTGSTVCGRYEDSGPRELTFTIVASHMAAQYVVLPIHGMFVDQHGEAAYIALGRKDEPPLIVN